MNTQKQWCVVYTRPRCEKKVAELLTKKKIENFCPVAKFNSSFFDRKKNKEEPLFSSFVFINVSEAQHSQVTKTEGILNFIYWLNSPAIISDEEIATIKIFTNDSYSLSLEKIKVDINATIKIGRGPLIQQEGDILEVKEKSLKIDLPSLGYAIIAVERNHIEIVNASVNSFLTLREKSRQIFNHVTSKYIFHASFR